MTADRAASAPAAERAALLRALPSVDAVRRAPGAADASTAEVRAVLDGLRVELAAGGRDAAPSAEEVAGLVAAARRDDRELAYPRVVNATGVVLHTGLGRAPLGARAAAAVSAIVDGYTTLEVDAETGERNQREQRLAADLAALTGAEAATVVNNNAGALMLAVAALAHGKDVIVSRGQLIEIGGSFRLPDVLAAAGGRLVEVGTTNRTYARDVDERLTWETGMVLVMHTSNYRVVGFEHQPSRDELVELTSVHGVPVLEDIGSGLLAPAPEGVGLDDEPDAASAIAAGVDLVCFSGDKLLGGPQAGVLVGKAPLIERCRAHPYFRALRCDRLALAALAGTLAAHRADPRELPVLGALCRSPAERGERARALASTLSARVPGATFRVVESEASAGSGSAPARVQPSAAVQVLWPGLQPDELARRLRTGSPSVFARVWRGQLQLDVIALQPGDDDRLVAALSALPAPAGGTA